MTDKGFTLGESALGGDDPLGGPAQQENQLVEVAAAAVEREIEAEYPGTYDTSRSYMDDGNRVRVIAIPKPVTKPSGRLSVGFYVEISGPLHHD